MADLKAFIESKMNDKKSFDQTKGWKLLNYTDSVGNYFF